MEAPQEVLEAPQEAPLTHPVSIRPSPCLPLSTPSHCCEPCNYKTYNSSLFSRHSKTEKHIVLCGLSNKLQYKGTCPCGNVYYSKNGLYKHRRKCNVEEAEETKDPETKEIACLTNIVMEVLKQNSEQSKMQQQLIDLVQQGMLAENAKNMNSHNNNNNVHVNTNTQNSHNKV